MQWSGSPPHVRGKVLKILYALRANGITPACAGKSEAGRSNAEQRQDHPRMCGEKDVTLLDDSHEKGSPPHVRGKGIHLATVLVDHGITPACAGKSVFVCFFGAKPEDHPRMCGEKSGLFWRQTGYAGSPPHVRGKANGTPRRRYSSRITPACAGKRCRKPRCWCRWWDHPRMCGEKPANSPGGEPELGSPPHVRGKAFFVLTTKRHKRITPACAGKRALSSSPRVALKDHPRMCGEKRRSSLRFIAKPGSPPHVRGKVRRLLPCRRRPGITPACAGKSGTRTCLPWWRKDHPRMCGEKWPHEL